MTLQIAFVCTILLFAQDVISGLLPQAEKKTKIAAFSFAEAQYFHRYTNGDQHEYTPNGQEDLNAWADMVTLQFYRKVKDGEALAATANAVLANYKTNQAMVVKTSSVPQTKAKPAEHLIVVLFPRPKFIEAVFARFRLRDGVGTAVIYSHRVYGEKVGNVMSDWLGKNGAAIENHLMKWDTVVKLPLPK
ncbi:MAG: hypothetical protein JST84_07295 [Acidobacteria bacterium]|nr:hypothetical protein [Acidobacteriota bacterium]